MLEDVAAEEAKPIKMDEGSEEQQYGWQTDNTGVHVQATKAVIHFRWAEDQVTETCMRRWPRRLAKMSWRPMVSRDQLKDLRMYVREVIPWRRNL